MVLPMGMVMVMGMAMVVVMTTMLMLTTKVARWPAHGRTWPNVRNATRQNRGSFPRDAGAQPPVQRGGGGCCTQAVGPVQGTRRPRRAALQPGPPTAKQSQDPEFFAARG